MLKLVIGNMTLVKVFTVSLLSVLHSLIYPTFSQLEYAYVMDALDDGSGTE
jgi:hypothetical protein